MPPPTNTHRQTSNSQKNVVFGRKYTEKANKNTVSRERQSSHVRLSESGGAVLKFKQQAVWKNKWKRKRETWNLINSNYLHIAIAFFRTYTQFKNKYGKVKLLLSITDKTYREVDTKKQTTLELFFSCYHVPKKTDILNLESKVKRNNEKNKKWWIKIADVKLKHTHTEPIFWRWKKRVKKLSKVKFTKNTKHIFTLLLLKQQILIYYRNYSHY